MSAREPALTREEIIDRRRKFRIRGYKTLCDVDFDGDWVTPYQKSSPSETGPVLVALHWLDVPSVEKYRRVLKDKGYLPGIPFNNVLECALKKARMSRADIYVTQVFHLLPAKRSQRILRKHLYESFESITRHEVVGRKAIALGVDAARAFHRAGLVPFTCVPHPSARGMTVESKAAMLAEALERAKET